MKRSRSQLLRGALVLGTALLTVGVVGGVVSAVPAGAVVAFVPHPGPAGFDPDDSDHDGHRADGPDSRRGSDPQWAGNPTATGPDNARGVGPEMRQEWRAGSGDHFGDRDDRPGWHSDDRGRRIG